LAQVPPAAFTTKMADGSAQQFLRRTCQTVQNYDRDGSALVPLGAWPLILEDLELDPDSEAAEFLKEHLDVADEGFFSYVPLLQAVGAVPADGPDSDAAPRRREDSPPPMQAPPMAPRRQQDSPSSPQQNQEFSQGASPQQQRQEMGPPADLFGRPSPQELAQAQAPFWDQERQPEVVPQRQQQDRSPKPSGVATKDSGGMGDILCGSSRRPEPCEEYRPGTAESVASTAFEDDGEDCETFWSRRATTIQHFYNLWDCNTLTNEAFAVQLQQILGSRADLTAADSEFVRLTNQHRFARNLKFAHLMSALRQDARRAKFAPPGFSPASTGISGYAASFNDAASECPSESPSHAAGRPSQKASLGLLGSSFGRKHYTPSDAGEGDDNISILSSRESNTGLSGGRWVAPKPRTPAPFADLSDLPSKQQNSERVQALPERRPAPFADGSPQARPNSGGYAKTTPPFAHGGNYAQGAPRRQMPAVDPNFWQNREQQQQRNGDGMSQCGQSDMGSVADSQREVFTARDRSGHGNILTWGNDSRQLTPPRSRTGRSLAVESDGRPTGHKTSGVFPAA